MHGANGLDFSNFIRFTEVITPERPEYYQGSSEPGTSNFKVIAAFGEMGDKPKTHDALYILISRTESYGSKVVQGI